MRVVGLKRASIYSPVNKNHNVKIQGTDRELQEASVSTLVWRVDDSSGISLQATPGEWIIW